MTTHIVRVITHNMTGNSDTGVPPEAWNKLAVALGRGFGGQLTIREHSDTNPSALTPQYTVDMALPGDARHKVVDVMQMADPLIDEVVSTYLHADKTLAR
jgi:hypothetical protein